MPTDAEQRETRQRLIRSLLVRTRVRSQRELVERLGREGVAATQSSVSRDLRDLGAAKLRGRYALPAAAAGPERQELRDAVSLVRAIRRAGPHLTVVGTAVGAAQAVAVALDRAGWPEVAGTVAGDDTIFVASAGARQQRRVIQQLEALRREGVGGEGGRSGGRGAPG